MAREGNILSPILRDAWDGKKLAPMTKNTPIEATGAHVSIIAHITRDELLRYFTSTEQTNGFGNRFIWIFVKRTREIPTPTGCPDETLNPLIERLRDSVNFARKVTTITRDEEAEAIWRGVYHDLSAEKDGLVGALLARSEPQVMRLACIYALMESSGVVQSSHLEAALALWAYSEQSAYYIFGELRGDPGVDRALEALKQAGRLTTTAIHNLFGRHADKGEVDRVVRELIKIAGVRSETIEDTGGRHALTLVWEAKKAN
jgi:DNA replicative helicase MCM subunit Mcm2 (Cdc46/Mcm family)